MRITRTALVATALLLWAAPGFAYGPGVHLRECARVAELMVSEGHPLAAIAKPEARPWLFLGCLAPDFRSATKALKGKPTHSSALGLHLIKAAQAKSAPPFALAFAVGHLCHHASDGSEEAFLTPTMTALALLGAPDVLPGVDDGPKAECETWTETLGEFPNGRMDLLVTWLGDMGLFQGAGIDWPTMLSWYAAEMNAWSGKALVDGKALVAELKALFAKAKAQVAGFAPATVLGLLDALKHNPPATNLQVLSALPIGDALAVIGISVGGKLDPVRWAAHKALPFFADATLFPKTYAAPFSDLGPRWTLDLLAKPRVDPDFPDWNIWAMRAAIRISLGHGMPEAAFEGHGRVLYDGAEWRDQSGKSVVDWQPGDGPVSLRVRVYVSEKTATSLVLRAHATTHRLRHPPATKQQGAAGTGPVKSGAVDLGAVVTWTSAPLQHDPMDYMVTTKRQWITLQVDPGPWVGKARQLVWSLARVDPGESPTAARPFVHGRWGLYQAFAPLDVWYPPYVHQRDDTGWPRALQLPMPATTTGSAIVVLRHGPAGGLFPATGAVATPPGGGAGVTLDPTAGARLILDRVSPGTWTLALGARPQDPPVDAAVEGDPDPPLAVTVLPGALTVVHAHLWAPLVPLSAVAPPCAAGTGGDTELRVAKLWPYSAQDMRVELQLRGAGGAVLWPAAGKRKIVALRQLDADPPPERLRYAVPIPGAALCEGGLPRPGLQLAVRLVYGDLKEADPQQAGRWRTVAPSFGSGDGADAGPTADTGTNDTGATDTGTTDTGTTDTGTTDTGLGDTAGGPDGRAGEPGEDVGTGVGGDVGPDAAHPTAKPAPAPDGGCSAGQRDASGGPGTPLPRTAGLALLAAAAVLTQRRRSGDRTRHEIDL